MARKKIDSTSEPAQGHRERVEAATEAATEVVEMERLQGESARNGQAERERLLGEYHQAVGQIKTANMFAEFANISALVWIKQMQETKAYKEFGTWENFCKSIGYSRQHVEDQLKNLSVLGEKFLQTVCGLGVGYRDLRRLRQLTHEGALQVEDGVLVIGDEEIPLDADHREDLQAAMERLLDAKEALISEKETTIRTKERLIEAKEQVIRKQEKELARHEGQAKERGYTPGEEAFLKSVADHRTIIDKLFLKVAPEEFVPTEATPRMKAAYVEMLGFIRRMAEALYDDGSAAFGELEEDGDWVQPGLEAELGASLAAARQKTR